MGKKRAPDFVPLPQVVSEIETTRKCDTATARQIVIDAHQLGDLDLRLRRPDGSTDTPLDRNNWSSPWWSPDLLFDNGGLIDAPARPRRGSTRRSMRRVQPDERCRIVVPRENLDVFLKPSAPLRKTTPKKKRRKANQPSRAGAPPKWDWDKAKIFAMEMLKQKGSPRDKKHKTDEWRADADLVRLVANYFVVLSEDGNAPDERTIRDKVSGWINDFEAGRN
jgi:hypothetical protein